MAGSTKRCRGTSRMAASTCGSRTPRATICVSTMRARRSASRSCAGGVTLAAGAAVLQTPPRVGALNPLGADALLRPGHVGGGVRGLDRSDDAVLAEAREVG